MMELRWSTKQRGSSNVLLFLSQPCKGNVGFGIAEMLHSMKALRAHLHQSLNLTLSTSAFSDARLTQQTNRWSRMEVQSRDRFTSCRGCDSLALPGHVRRGGWDVAAHRKIVHNAGGGSWPTVRGPWDASDCPRHLQMTRW